MPWYKQTSIWGLIISVLALVLSQLPSILSWVPRYEVSAELSSRVGLPTYMGIPAYQLFIDVKNKGNRQVSVSDFTLDVEYPNGTKKTLVAQSYTKITPGQPFPTEFPLTSVSLSSGQSWSEMVSFAPRLSPSEDEDLNKFKLLISQSISSRAPEPGQPYSGPIEADPTIVSEATGFFDRKFDLEKGTYKASVICSVNGKPTTLRAFEFTLYDFHIATLRSQKDDFKYGAGVYFPRNTAKEIWAIIQSKS